jgi:hypothetical protein
MKSWSCELATLNFNINSASALPLQACVLNNYR